MDEDQATNLGLEDSFLVSKEGVQHGEGDLFGHRTDKASVCHMKHLQAGAVLGWIAKTYTEELQNFLVVRHLSHQFHLTLTPRVAENIILCDLEMCENVGEFVHEEIDGEELSRFIFEVAGSGVTDLIVEKDRSGMRAWER